MAADFWNSTQRRNWSCTRDTLTQARSSLDGNSILAQQFPLPEYRLLSLFFHQQLLRLVKRLNLRQAPLATAQVYVRRFYTKVAIRDTNPYLLLATALYVACKIEESPTNIRLVVAEARLLWPEYIGPDIASLGEMEFRLISLMGCELILHHPYRTMRYIETTFHLTQDETNLAWGTINDSYLTDLALLYPPHVTAWSAAFLALSMKVTTSQSAPGSGPQSMAQMVAAALREGKDATTLGTTVGGHHVRLQRFLEALAESEVDLTAVSDAAQEIISLYVLWESFREKETKEQIARFVKAQGLEK